MTFRIGKTAFRVHPLLLIIWPVSCLMDHTRAFFGCLCALFLHEGGHLLAACCMKIPVLEIELSPIGGFMTLEDAENLPCLKGVILSAAGPLFSLAGFLLAAQYGVGMDFFFALSFARTSLLLFLFNLLPALPLDGGNIVRHVLSRFFPWRQVSRILTAVSYAFSLSFCCLSLYFALRGQLALSPALAGLYLMYATRQEQMQSAGRYITALIARRERLDTMRALPVECLAVSARMPVIRLLPFLHTQKYHFVQVLSPDGMRTLKLLDETEVMQLLLSHPHDSVGDHLSQI